MAEFKKAPLTGGRSTSSQNVLGRLRDVQIISSQVRLPTPILEHVLDYLPVPELIRFARTSKRMRDIVYDDARWVKKLRAMGCWSEAEARASIDAKTLEAEGIDGSAALKATRRASLTPKSPMSPSTPRVILTGTAKKSNTELLAEASPGLGPVNKKTDGGSEAVATSVNSDSESRQGSSSETLTQLAIFKTVRSIRGRARQEYGKVHAVLRPFYKDALRVKNPSSAKIFRIYRDPTEQAQMLVQMQTFAKSDGSPGEKARNERLDAMFSAFEDAVANEFEQGLQMEDVEGRMKKYANVMVVLNGGQRAVNLFFAQNALLRNEEKLGDPADCVSPTNNESLFDDEIHAFCSRLSASINRQLSIMEKVFPPTVEIVGPYISRVGDGVIAPYVARLFELCYQKSMEVYLRAVSSTFAQLFHCSRTLTFPPASKKEFYEQFDDIINEHFTSHFGTYLAEEIAFFKRKSETEVGAWERQLSQQDSSIESLYMANVNRQAAKRDFLSSFKKVVMMPVNAFPSFQSKPSSTKPANGAATPTVGDSTLGEPTRSSTPSIPGRMNRSPSRPPSPLVDPPTTELAAKAAIMKARLEGIGSLFSLEVALNLVHMAKAGIERLAIFTLTDEFAPGARSQAEAIFLELLKILGDRHVRAGFDKAVGHLEAYNPRSEDREPGKAIAVAPLAMFLELVNVGDLIQQMLDVFFEQELVAQRLTDKQDFMNPGLKGKKKFEQMLDERVAAGLNTGIEVLMTEVEYQFATTQKPEDFNPDAAGDHNVIVDVGPSQTAQNVAELLASVTGMLVGSTDKTLLDVFNQEVGLRLYNAFCKHLKRQRVSVAGAIRLISDINQYYAFILTFKNRDLQQYFNALRELSQIYLIGPENAKEIATIIADKDRFRGIMRSEEVYEFTERRADWFQIRGRVEKAMYGVGCSVM